MEGVEKIKKTIESETEEFHKGFEFPDKRKLKVNLAWVNEDGTLEEIINTESEGVFLATFDSWHKDEGIHEHCSKCVVKIGTKDIAMMITADENMKPSAEAIAKIYAMEKMAEMLKGVMKGDEEVEA